VTIAILALGLVGAALFGVFSEEESIESAPTVPRKQDPAGVVDDGGGAGPAPRAAKTDRFDGSEDVPTVDAVKRGVPSTDGGYKLIGEVVSGDGAVVGARVDLMEDNGSMAGVHQLGALVETVVSDAEGRFSFEGVEPGVRMILRATHVNYTMGRAYGIDAAQPGTLHQVIRVEGGFRIKGKVTHKDGRPLEGVRVASYDVNLQAFEPEDQLERAVLTATDGSYELRGLAKGMKRVLATQAGLASKSLPTFQVPSQNESIDFVMEDGLTVEGRVVERGASHPVPGARVMYRPTGSRSRGAGRRVESVRADDDGRFTLIGLLSGNCDVWARGDAHLQSTPQTVQAGSTNVLIQLPPAARIEGTVVDGETGEPIERYTLLITGNEDIIIPSRMYRRRVKDPEGRFLFAGVRPMKLWLVVRAKGYAETLHGPLQIAEGEVLSGIEVKVGRGATVRGRVIDSVGAPIPVAKVTLSRSGVDMNRPEAIFLGPLIENHAPKVHGVTKADGTYEISGLRGGTWKVRAEHARYATEIEARVIVDGSGISEAPDLTLQEAGGIRGIVRAEGGGPDAKARLTIAALNNQLLKFSASTGPDGRFEQLGIPPGDYRIQVVQREGVVNLGGILGAMGRGEAPKVYTVQPGVVLEVEL